MRQKQQPEEQKETYIPSIGYSNDLQQVSCHNIRHSRVSFSQQKYNPNLRTSIQSNFNGLQKAGITLESNKPISKSKVFTPTFASKLESTQTSLNTNNVGKHIQNQRCFWPTDLLLDTTGKTLSQLKSYIQTHKINTYIKLDLHDHLIRNSTISKKMTNSVPIEQEEYINEDLKGNKRQFKRSKSGRGKHQQQRQLKNKGIQAQIEKQTQRQGYNNTSNVNCNSNNQFNNNKIVKIDYFVVKLSKSQSKQRKRNKNNDDQQQYNSNNQSSQQQSNQVKKLVINDKKQLQIETLNGSEKMARKIKNKSCRPEIVYCQSSSQVQYYPQRIPHSNHKNKQFFNQAPKNPTKIYIESQLNKSNCRHHTPQHYHDPYHHSGNNYSHITYYNNKNEDDRKLNRNYSYNVVRAKNNQQKNVCQCCRQHTPVNFQEIEPCDVSCNHSTVKKNKYQINPRKLQCNINQQTPQANVQLIRNCHSLNHNYKQKSNYRPNYKTLDINQRQFLTPNTSVYYKSIQSYQQQDQDKNWPPNQYNNHSYRHQNRRQKNHGNQYGCNNFNIKNGHQHLHSFDRNPNSHPCGYNYQGSQFGCKQGGHDYGQGRNRGNIKGRNKNRENGSNPNGSQYHQYDTNNQQDMSSEYLDNRNFKQFKRNIVEECMHNFNGNQPKYMNPQHSKPCRGKGRNQQTAGRRYRNVIEMSDNL